MTPVDAETVQRLRGSPVERREDRPLLTGDARYTDDIQPPDVVHMAVVRSQYAHARIEAIDTSAAEEMDGVLAVYTADDVDVPGEIPPVWLLPDLKTPPYPMLARERVRYQGQPIAVVIAEERYRAHDGIDAIGIDYERLDAVTSPSEALEDGASQLGTVNLAGNRQTAVG